MAAYLDDEDNEELTAKEKKKLDKKKKKEVQSAKPVCSLFSVLLSVKRLLRLSFLFVYCDKVLGWLTFFVARRIRSV